MKVVYKYPKIYLVLYLCMFFFFLFMAILNTYDTLGNIILACVLILTGIRIYFSYKRLGNGIFYNDTHLIFIINGKEETIKRTDISSIHFKKKIIYSLINLEKRGQFMMPQIELHSNQTITIPFNVHSPKNKSEILLVVQNIYFTFYKTNKNEHFKKRG